MNKMSKIGRKLVMLCKKAKNAERKEVACILFCHPLGDFRAPPPEDISATPWEIS